MDIHAENVAVLLLVSAMIGYVSRGVQAISLEVLPGRVVLYFAATERTVEIEEDVTEIADELVTGYESGFDGPSPTVETDIYVGLVDDGWPGRKKRFVYWSKESYLAISNSPDV